MGFVFPFEIQNLFLNICPLCHVVELVFYGPSTLFKVILSVVS